MFKVEGKKIIWGDCSYELPAEVADKTIEKVFGTATAGLIKSSGIFLEANGDSAKLSAAPDGEFQAGHLVGPEPDRGTLVYLREQFEPATPFKAYWLVSSEPIHNDLNWINVKFTDGTLLRLCPFTLQYEVE